MNEHDKIQEYQNALAATGKNVQPTYWYALSWQETTVPYNVFVFIFEGGLTEAGLHHGIKITVRSSLWGSGWVWESEYERDWVTPKSHWAKPLVEINHD